MTITDEKLDEWIMLCAEALPGPWTAIYKPGKSYLECKVVNTDRNIEILPYARTADANFVAKARTAMPALIAEIRRLREALQFYADSDCWESHGHIGTDGFMYDTLHEPNWKFDKGQKAREALQ